MITYFISDYMYTKNTLIQSDHFLKKHGWLIIHVILILGVISALSGCKSSSSTTDSECTYCKIDTSAITKGTAEGSAETGYNADDLVENASFTSVVTINFGSTITISNPLASAGVTITQNNGAVIINSSVAGVNYQLSGLTTSGAVKIYSTNDLKLTLSGLNLINPTGPAINIQSSKKTFVVLDDPTINTLADGTTYTASTENQKGTLFSEGPMIFSGNGSLNVTGNYQHGIVSDSYIRIRNGIIAIANALKDGIHSSSSFIADGGYVTLTAQNDGIACEAGPVIINSGTFGLQAVDNAIAASYAGTNTSVTPYVTINGGTFTIKTTAGAGILSSSVLTINSASISATTVNPGLSAGTAAYINDGSIYCYSTGNDAMYSAGTFTITGGKVIAVTSKSAKAGIDCGARTFKITGGIVIGTGTTTSAPSATASTVHSVILGSGSAAVFTHIEATDGTEALTFLAPQAYSTLLFASAKLKASTTYNVYTAGSAAGKSFNGLYLTGAYTKVNTKSSSFTTTTLVTQAGGTSLTN